MWPLVAYAAVVVGIAASMIGVSYLLGQRHSAKATNDPYESGLVPTGTTQIKFSAHFYLVALFFLIFDLVAAFIFAWAVAAREVGWQGYLGLVVFVMVLTVILIYEWRQGALDWGVKPRERLQGNESISSGSGKVGNE